MSAFDPRLGESGALVAILRIVLSIGLVVGVAGGEELRDGVEEEEDGLLVNL